MFINKRILGFLLVMFSISLIGLTQVSTAKATDDSAGINFLTNVLESISLSASSGSLDFGNLAAGIPERGSGGINAGVRTNSSFGYSLSISDSNSGNNSALRHTDTVTYIPDFLDGTITTPALWSEGASVGFGFTVFAADTSKEAKWGNGATYNSTNNKYAGIPQNATVFHNSAGFKNGLDTTSLTFVVDVLADQKGGAYSGIATLTAVSLLE